MAELSGNLTESFPRFLREKSLKEIQVRGLSRTDLAEKLDLFPAGVDRIMSQKEWPASLGCKVLDALDITVEIEFFDRNKS